MAALLFTFVAFVLFVVKSFSPWRELLLHSHSTTPCPPAKVPAA